MTFENNGKMEIFWIVPDLNRRRYYRMSVEAGLFGPVLVRTWGRSVGGSCGGSSSFFQMGS